MVPPSFRARPNDGGTRKQRACLSGLAQPGTSITLMEWEACALASAAASRYACGSGRYAMRTSIFLRSWSAIGFAGVVGLRARVHLHRARRGLRVRSRCGRRCCSALRDGGAHSLFGSSETADPGVQGRRGLHAASDRDPEHLPAGEHVHLARVEDVRAGDDRLVQGALPK